MPRSYSVFLIAILAGGGWFFTAGPGKGNFGKFVAQFTQQQGQGQVGGYAPYTPAAPNYSAPGYSTPATSASYQSTAVPLPAQYASQSVPAGPAPPSPAFGGPSIRIASFNIQVFGDAKASKPYIMATLAAAIHNFHIVAIQEIRTQDDYFLDNFLRNYVNQNGRVYNKVVGQRLGRSNSTEQYAYIYDTAAIEVNPRSVYTINDPDDLLHREPLVAMFRVRGPPPQSAFTFVLVNVHTDPSPEVLEAEVDALGMVYQAVRRSTGGEDDIIMLGDFNVDDNHLGQLGQIEGVRPIIRGVYSNTRQSKLYDNIIIHQQSTAEFSGRWGVYNLEKIHGLTRDQALQVSDHLPVWAEFSSYESSAPGRMATRPGGQMYSQ